MNRVAWRSRRHPRIEDVRRHERSPWIERLISLWNIEEVVGPVEVGSVGGRLVARQSNVAQPSSSVIWLNVSVVEAVVLALRYDLGLEVVLFVVLGVG